MKYDIRWWMNKTKKNKLYIGIYKKTITSTKQQRKKKIKFMKEKWERITTSTGETSNKH